MRALMALVAISVLSIPETAMAQQQEDESHTEYLARLKAEAEKDAAETARINAQAALITAQANLQKAELTDPESELEKTKLELETALETLKKGTSEAELAAIKAEVAKVVEPLTAIKASGIEGEVTTKEDTGKLEATLLASSALESAAKKVKSEIGSAPSGVLIVKTSDTNPVVSLLALRATQAELLRLHGVINQDDGDFGSAEDLYADVYDIVHGDPPSPLNAGAEGLTSTVAIIGGLLDAGSKLLSYFKSDYEFGGIEVSLSDNVFMSALAGEYDGKAATISSLQWAYKQDDLDEIIKEFDDEKTDVQAKELDILALRRRITDLTAEVESDISDEVQKKDLKEKLEKAGEHLDAAKGYVTAFGTEYAAYVKGVSNPESAIFIGKLLPALAYERFTAGASVKILRVKVEFVGGSYYTKKNIGTGLGGMPYEAAGGTVVSYELLNPTTGTIDKAGIIPVHGGYKDIDDIAKDSRFK